MKDEIRNPSVEQVREPPINCQKDNIIGDPNAGRSRRDRTKGRSLFTMGDPMKDFENLESLPNSITGMMGIFQGMFLSTLQANGWHLQPPRPPDAEDDKENNVIPLDQLDPVEETPEDCSSKVETQ